MPLKTYSTSQNSWLPVTRNMPYTSASVPYRSHNMTGIYLGLESNSRPPRSKSAIPPLARGRGIAQRVRTPAEDRRYKLVEHLRIKEVKTGFTGGIKKNCRSALVGNSHRENPQEGHTVLNRKWGPGKLINPDNIDDFIRPNARSFTAVSNSGVTRLEQLISPSSLDVQDRSPYTREELFSLAEFYRKICKNNDVSLSSLLPGRRHQQASGQESTGFTVRSYINPHKAEILAQFQDRGKLWPNTFQKSGPADFRVRGDSPRIKKSRSSGTRVTETVARDTYEHLVLPDISGDLVAGSATGGLHYRIAPFSGRLESGEEYMLNSSKVIGSSDQYQGSGVSDTKQSPSVVLPLRTEQEGEKESVRGEEESEEEDQFGEDKEEDTSETKGKDQFGEDKEEGQFSEDNMNQVMLSGDVLNSGLEVRPRVKLTTSNSGADIMLGLETDDGKSAEVEIDSLETDDLQPEDIPKGRVRKTSIVEKLSKSKESELIALSLMESAGQRQREFEKLISEHQELVHEISRTPSAENIVQSEAGRDP